MFSVKGKRKRPSETATHADRRSNGRGRRMKRHDELSASEEIIDTGKQNAKVRSLSPLPTTGTSLSQLEQLPNELIQQIFFNCLEISMARASMHLAQALSTESTYNILILFAYFEDDKKSPVEAKLFLPAAYSQLKIEERVRLQRDLLNCRWCTRDRISACLPTLGRLAMLQAWHRERQDMETTRNRTLVLPDGVLREAAFLPNSDDMDGMIRHFFAQSEVQVVHDSTHNNRLTVRHHGSYLPRIITWRWSFQSSDSMIKAVGNRYTIVAARVLPDWLIRGSPWTQDKLDLLQLLRQGSRFVENETVLEISAPAVFQGMASAIRERNLEALLTLLELHDDIFKGLSPGTNSPSDEPLLDSHHRYLPKYLYHLATEAGESSAKVMWLLARAGVESIPKDDHKLTAWALHYPEEGNSMARWLLHHMSDDTQHGMWPADCFLHGHLWSRVPNSSFPLTRYSFPEELGYLEGANAPRWTQLNGDPYS